MYGIWIQERFTDILLRRIILLIIRTHQHTKKTCISQYFGQVYLVLITSPRNSRMIGSPLFWPIRRTYAFGRKCGLAAERGGREGGGDVAYASPCWRFFFSSLLVEKEERLFCSASVVGFGWSNPQEFDGAAEWCLAFPVRIRHYRWRMGGGGLH